MNREVVIPANSKNETFYLLGVGLLLIINMFVLIRFTQRDDPGSKIGTHQMSVYENLNSKGWFYVKK